MASDPHEHDSRVPLMLGIQIPLFFIASVTYVLRMYTRLHKLWWDDIFISLAMICSIISVAIFIASIATGYGRHSQFLTPSQNRHFIFLTWLSQPFWGMEMICIKTSIAFMFLRLTRSWSRLWRYAMIFTIVYVTAITVAGFSVNLTTCRPIHLYWDGPRDERCRPVNEMYRTMIGVSVAHGVSDLQFSLLPWTFIHKLRRSWKERISVALLMSLGLVATIIGGVKFVGYGTGFGKDLTWLAVPVKLGSFCEATLGIVAANAPPLKAPAERLWRRWVAQKTEEECTPVVVRKKEMHLSSVGSWLSWEEAKMEVREEAVPVGV